MHIAIDATRHCVRHARYELSLYNSNSYEVYRRTNLVKTSLRRFAVVVHCRAAVAAATAVVAMVVVSPASAAFLDSVYFTRHVVINLLIQLG